MVDNLGDRGMRPSSVDDILSPFGRRTDGLETFLSLRVLLYFVGADNDGLRRCRLWPLLCLNFYYFGPVRLRKWISNNCFL